jgi:hypothetical protein
LLTGSLLNPERRIAEEVVDGKQLGESARVGVGLLRGEDRVSEPLVLAARDLLHRKGSTARSAPAESLATRKIVIPGMSSPLGKTADNLQHPGCCSAVSLPDTFPH